MLDELIDSDLAAIEVELAQAMTDEQKAARPKQQPKRTPLPERPYALIQHEPENIHCRCGCQLKRIGDDIMSLTQSTKLNGHVPYAYLKDVLTRLLTQKNNTIDELLFSRLETGGYAPAIHPALLACTVRIYRARA